MKRHQKRDMPSFLTMRSDPIPYDRFSTGFSRLGDRLTACESTAEAPNGEDLDMHQLPFLYKFERSAVVVVMP